MYKVTNLSDFNVSSMSACAAVRSHFHFGKKLDNSKISNVLHTKAQASVLCLEATLNFSPTCVYSLALFY